MSKNSAMRPRASWYKFPKSMYTTHALPLTHGIEKVAEVLGELLEIDGPVAIPVGACVEYSDLPEWSQIF